MDGQITNVRIKTSEYITINARRTIHQTSKGLPHQSYPQKLMCEKMEGTEQRLTTVGAGCQRGTVEQEMSFAISKPSRTISAGQSWLPPTNEGNLRDDCFIRSSLPKFRLSEFSGYPLKWLEWSQLFQATVHAANREDSVKMNYPKTMVTGKTKEAIAGLGYTAEIYIVAWNVLVCNFWKPQMVVNAQQKSESTPSRQ